MYCQRAYAAAAAAAKSLQSCPTLCDPINGSPPGPSVHGILQSRTLADCLEDSTVICGRCGERLWADDDQGNEDSGHLCQSCYDRYYNTCDECHRIICEEDAYYEDDDRVLCYDCHRRHRSRYSINDYSYKPDPIFYGSDTLFMGVEIELDEGGESDNQARKLLEIANAESERIYCKHDGSLNDGFEVVSHPMTLDYHMKTMPWQAVLEKARQLDYRSHQAKTCGLHIHVNRTAFGDNIAEQEEVIARINNIKLIKNNESKNSY